jgi:hypothetical protein
LEDIIYGDRFYILFENKYYQRFTPFDNTEHGNFLDLNIFERTMVYYSVHTHPRNGYPGASDHLLSNLFLLKGRVYGWNGVQYDYYRDKDFW